MRILPQRKYLRNAVEISKNAVQELKKEQFNSKTLNTLFYDERFVSKNKDTTIVISRETGEPVKVYKDIFVENMQTRVNGTTTYCDLVLYSDEAKNHGIGSKKFRIENYSKNSRMAAGYMQNFDKDLIGLGIREDEYQIETAIERGFKSIPRISYPQALLYHLKMGFTPVQKLIRVRTEEKVNSLLKETANQARTIKNENFTPVIVERKGLFGKRYYFDENTTLALAYLRTIRANLANKTTSRPDVINGTNIDLELTGENLQKWADMLSGK